MKTIVTLIGYKEDVYNPAGWCNKVVVNYIEDLEGCSFTERTTFEVSTDEFQLTDSFFDTGLDPYAEGPKAGIDYLVTRKVPLTDDEGTVRDEDVYAVSLNEISSERISKEEAMERLEPSPF